MLSCSFCLYRFRKYVSYGFPRINFCNPRVHYETPCIWENTFKIGPEDDDDGDESHGVELIRLAEDRNQ